LMWSLISHLSQAGIVSPATRPPASSVKPLPYILLQQYFLTVPTDPMQLEPKMPNDKLSRSVLL